MRFKGKVENKIIYGLINSDNTHSFIEPYVLQGVKCRITQTPPLIVMQAKGPWEFNKGI
jgi:hypothetical protein